MELALLAIAAQTVRISIPYLLAALGGTVSERAGVVNIGLEGILLAGAFGTVVAAHQFHDPWIGLAAGILSGMLLATLHAVVTVIIKADQIVSGLALNMLAVGGTKFLLSLIFHSSSNSDRVEGMPTWNLPGILSNPMIWVAFIALALVHFLLFHTVYGLRLRAVGEHPEAAETLGISVTFMRFHAVLLGGALAGAGGAWLALDQHSFTQGMSAGRGYIALAAMIVGKWRPLGALAACLLFGFAETMQIRLQGTEHVPAELLQTLPYLLTIIVLCGWIGRSVPPAAVGVPYEKERAD